MRHFHRGLFLLLVLACSLGMAYPGLAAAPAASGNALSAPQRSAGFEEDVEWQPPRRLEPIRTQTPLPELERAVQASLFGLEEEARRLAAEEERQARDLQAAQERDRLRLEDERARTEAREARELQEARGRAITAALRSAAPPPPAVIPLKQDWPLPEPIEPEAWMPAEIREYYLGGASERAVRDSYTYFLGEAIQGNPRAMLILSHAYGEWGGGVSSSFSVLYEPMHQADYWRAWAMRIAGEAWTSLRLGDLNSDAAKKAAYYREAAGLGNAEARYKLYLMGENPELLVQAALAGHAPAAARLASNLVEGREGFPQSPRLAASFWWRATLAGDAEASLVCSEYFRQGRDGFPKDERRAYLWALQAAHRLQAEPASSTGDADGKELAAKARAQLASIEGALRLSAEEKWRLQQELEIYLAAPREAALARLERQASSRAEAILELHAELRGVAEVLSASQPEASEQQLLERMHQALEHEQYQELLKSQQALERERRQNALEFIFWGAVTLLLVGLIYLSLRLHLYSRVVKLVAVDGGKV